MFVWLLRICWATSCASLREITKEFFPQLFSNSTRGAGAIKMHSIFHEKFYHDSRIEFLWFWRVHKFPINWLIIWDFFACCFRRFPFMTNQHTFRKSRMRRKSDFEIRSAQFKKNSEAIGTLEKVNFSIFHRFTLHLEQFRIRNLKSDYAIHDSLNPPVPFLGVCDVKAGVKAMIFPGFSQPSIFTHQSPLNIRFLPGTWSLFTTFSFLSA